MAAGIRRVAEIRALPHERWIEIAEHHNDAFINLLAALDPYEWGRTTECELWSVKDVAGHVLGAAESWTSFRELKHQFLGSLKRRKELGSQLNAMNEIQVDDRRHLSGTETLQRLQEALPRFLALRARLGRVGRWIPMWEPNLGRASVRYLIDTIYTRDVFMHRLDVARATSRSVPATEADADLVADVVRDWARRSRANVTLELLGPAGGTFVAGSGDIRVLADAVDFCRLMSGRRGQANVEAEGDDARATAWIGGGCPF